MGVVVTFLIIIVFSILLPSGDQGSDIYFWYSTVNFVGNGEMLFGCRDCFRMIRSDIYEKDGVLYRSCFSTPNFVYSNSNGSRISNIEFKNTNETFYQFNHGSDSCHSGYLNKALDYELTNKNGKTRGSPALYKNDSPIVENINNNFLWA